MKLGKAALAFMAMAAAAETFPITRPRGGDIDYVAPQPGYVSRKSTLSNKQKKARAAAKRAKKARKIHRR